MGEIEERIEQILNDPAQMERLNRMAQSLFGGDSAPPEEAAGIPGFDPALLARLSRLMTEDAGAERSREGLLHALEPWLAPGRRERLARALRLARLSSLARRAFGEGEEHV